MGKETEAQRRAHLKYRREKVKYLSLQYRIKDFRIVDAYCNFINMPIATWVKSLIDREIQSDKSFHYVPSGQTDTELKRRNVYKGITSNFDDLDD